MKIAVKINQDLQDYLKDWILYLKNQKLYSKHTLKAYNSDLSYFLKFISMHINQEISLPVLEKITVTDFRSWLAYRRNNNIGAVSNTRALSAVRTFFNYLNNYANISNDAIHVIKVRKLQKSLPKTLFTHSALEAIDIIKYSIDLEKQWVSSRNYVILLLLYSCGLKISETIDLKLSDFVWHDVLENITHTKSFIVDESIKDRSKDQIIFIKDLYMKFETINQHVLEAKTEAKTQVKTQVKTIQNERSINFINSINSIIIRGKGAKEKFIPLLPITITSIQQYIALCPYDLNQVGFLFVGIRGAKLNPDVFRAKIRSIKHIIGLSKYASLNTLRSYINLFYANNNNIDIKILQELLRRTSIQSMQKYTKIDTEKLISDYVKYHPRAKNSL